MKFAPLLILSVGTIALAATALTKLPDAPPANWTTEQVYQILHNSPWTRVLKMSFPAGGALMGQGDTGQGAPPPPTANAGGGMGGRRGGGGRSGTYSSGGGRNAPASNAKTPPTEVLIQWQSALVVRIAAAKKAGGAVDVAALKPLDEYIVAVIGLPITAVGGRAASADSDNTITAAEQQRIQDNVKASASILCPGHDPLTPTKVELDQGADGRMLIHFPKTYPITANEKTVELKMVSGKSEIRKKFPLKEMEYEGKLEL